jgi:NAD(P)H-nitrite reductase large subunit
VAFEVKKRAQDILIRDSTKDNSSTSTNDITSLVDRDRPKYVDTRSRITPYIDNDVLKEFKAIVGDRKGLQSEIIERLMIQFIADVKEKRKVPEWEIPK